MLYYRIHHCRNNTGLENFVYVYSLKKLFNDKKIILVLIVRKVRRAHEWANRQLIRARARGQIFHYGYGGF